MPNYHCKKCDQEDTEEMVACDHCGEWFHFACVAVDSTVADRSWNCESCQADGPIAASSPTSDISGATRHVQFTLPKLNKQPSTSSKSIPTTTQTPFSATTTTTHTQTHFSVTTAQNSRTFQHPKYSEGRMQQAPHDLSSAQATSNTTAGADNSLFLRDLQLKRLEEEMELQKRYLENKYKILSQSEDFNVTYNPVGATTPTSTQIAARHTMPNNLPAFNGDPDEWPLFISSFENSTAVAGFSNAENLMRLQSCLKGRARDMVKCKLLLPSMVPEIIQTLRLCFGRPEHILERAINKARHMPAIKDKLEAIIEFALCVRNICATIESCHLDEHLHNPFLIKELVDKLPNTHKLNWAMFPKDPKVPVVKQFSDWLYQLAEAASTVVTLSPFKGSATVNTHTIADDDDQNQQRVDRPQQMRKCGVCASENHKVPQCEEFRNAELTRKWEFVRQKNLCRQCLGTHSKRCFSNKVCGINGCSAKHHQLLHKDKEPSAVVSQMTPTTSKNVQLNTHNSSGVENQPYFRILPIKLYSHGQSFNTFAFLDEGSAVTLIEKSVFEQFGLQGIPEPICLRWTGSTTREERESVKANIEISSVTSGHKYELKNVHTVDSLGLPAQSLDIKEIYKRYPHLTGLPIQPYEKAIPTILIGVNNWKLAIPLKIREGRHNQPIASKTRLGWTLQGCDHGNSSEFRLNVHRCDCKKGLDEIHEMIKEHFSMETPRPTQLLSADDNQAIKILNDTCKKINGRYEVGLTWREKDVVLPESYPNALKRSLCLRKKIDKAPKMKRTIQAQIDNLVSKGYAEKLSLNKSVIQTHKTWYLPIFIVTNPNKAGKVRLVWDAASKVNNMSLNDFLLSGPDLLNPLVEVLLAFRVGKIAICGDIAEMFHRINVRDSDMYAQCFLWWNDDDDIRRPSIYVMRALTFGVCCAPFIAHFIRDKNAENFKTEFPRAVQAVQKCHYVDDFIDSEDDETSAIELAIRVKQIHVAAGFNIRNWASNSTRLLEKLGENPATEQNTKDWGSATKVLGMYWEPGNDLFRYIFRFARLKRDVINDPVIPTKRETLQVLMSIFDPLGLISCYTIGLKILLQNIWRSGITWDEPLTDNLFEKWSKWKSNIQLITSVEIPRCYSVFLQEATSVQLHTFVDAGENAYAAICYLRVEHAGEVSVALIAAKSKVAPLKTLSIPRLELQAALIGVRMAKTVLNVDRIRTTSQIWWTDSKTVLKWLHMDPKNFQQFVMHRVGEIVESSNVSQWKWVPSKMNPADLSTKTTTRTNAQLWFSGTEFLLSPSDNWPIWEPKGSTENIDAELKSA